jgi:hypothetical protein
MQLLGDARKLFRPRSALQVDDELWRERERERELMDWMDIVLTLFSLYRRFVIQLLFMIV